MPAERLFFALWPPTSVRDALVAERAALPEPQGRCNHPLDLHLTLVFVGTVPGEIRPCVEAAAAGIAVPPFGLVLDEIGAWPRKPMRWARPTAAPQPLIDLVRALEANLRRCGVEPEKRTYRPHVTLARKTPPIPVRALAEPLAWPVREFVLAASQSGRTPSYEVLRRWPLPVS
jgi:2'-5' RNA ligase